MEQTLVTFHASCLTFVDLLIIYVVNSAVPARDPYSLQNYVSRVISFAERKKLNLVV